MKLENIDDFGGKKIVSEGKQLQITPIITDASGQPNMLPATTYRVPNWLVGYADDHVVGMPATVYTNYRCNIPGSGPRYNTTISFLIQILEDSAEPFIGTTIDRDAAMAIIDAIRHAPAYYKEP